MESVDLCGRLLCQLTAGSDRPAALPVKDKETNTIHLRRAGAKIKTQNDTLKAKTNDLALFNPDIKPKQQATIFLSGEVLLRSLTSCVLCAFCCGSV